MVGTPQGSVTELLRACSQGEPGALDALLPLVYEELRRRASSYLRGERHNHTLAATALVHEAYLRLVGQKAEYQNRAQFFAVAATMMRRVLIDHARARAAAKRPRPKLQIALTPEIPVAAPEALDILELDLALDELASVDARQARLVELRYFGGLTSEEAAVALGVSLTTAKREWNMAKAWLYRRLSQTARPGT